MRLCKRCETEIADDAAVCPVCGAPQGMAVKAEVHSPTKEKSPKCRWRKAIPWFVALCFICIVLEFEGQLKEKDTIIAALAWERDTLSEDVADQKDTIARCRRELNSLSDIYDALTGDYERICDFLVSENQGYATNTFKASESVFVLRMGDEPVPFTLTTSFKRMVTVDVTAVGQSATIEYSGGQWYPSTTIFAIPLSPGATVFTFSNDQNDKSFQVMVVVLE